MARPRQLRCHKAHLLSGTNVRYKPNGNRECWACRRSYYWESQALNARSLSRLLFALYCSLEEHAAGVIGWDIDRLRRVTRSCSAPELAWIFQVDSGSPVEARVLFGMASPQEIQCLIANS